ncbi:hypothetical protein [Streptomyces nymphaeiformis]|uniref:Uncharacterized protein n=1 Tax=Streptomyces nymphaeiformis TaxID=2663842 RepID=A0A7W7U4W0_9ACTN|nr:hypothetical protein [Streptomyces nymphaeiformis]MBB4984989.1 hypothetical protein [Streptomyces nymphaeiformis]
MSSNETPGEHVGNLIPMVTADDGRAYISADNVVALLRAIAETHRDLADHPDCDLRDGAASIDREADAISCRAIAWIR